MGIGRTKGATFGVAASALAMVVAPPTGSQALAAPVPAGIQDATVLHPGPSEVTATIVLVPKTYAPPLSTVPGTGVRLQPVVARAYKKLVSAARKDGVGIWLSSGCRS